MAGGAAAEVLPVAVAIALSPFPVIPSILLVFSERARAAGSAFAAGWATGVAAATAIFALLGGAIELADSRATWVSWLLVVVGAALVVLGVRQWWGQRGGSDAGGAAEQPAWMASLSSATPGRAFVLGLGLSGANPKIVLLGAAAGLSIAEVEAGLAASTLVVLLVAAVGSIGVVLPVLLHAVAGDRILGPLGRARDWLVRHNTAITAVVVAVIGVAVVSEGAAGL